MALIICHECEGKVSEYATCCPHCGCPIELIKLKRDTRFVEKGESRILSSAETEKSIHKSTSSKRITLLPTSNILAIAAGPYHIAVLGRDGKCYPRLVENFSIKLGKQRYKQISCGYNYTAGITDEGFVGGVYSSPFVSEEKIMSEARDVVQISAGYETCIALKSNGTIVGPEKFLGDSVELRKWDNIIGIAAGHGHYLGLKFDGTVCACGNNFYGQLLVGDWENIAKVVAGEYFSIGITHEGKVLAVGDNCYGQIDGVENWRNIVEIAAGFSHTVGLMGDGEVVASGDNSSGQCFVGHWENIVSVAAGYNFTLGLSAFGLLYIAGGNQELRELVDRINDEGIECLEADMSQRVVSLKNISRAHYILSNVKECGPADMIVVRDQRVDILNAFLAGQADDEGMAYYATCYRGAADSVVFPKTYKTAIELECEREEKEVEVCYDKFHFERNDIVKQAFFCTSFIDGRMLDRWTKLEAVYLPDGGNLIYLRGEKKISVYLYDKAFLDRCFAKQRGYKIIYKGERYIEYVGNYGLKETIGLHPYPKNIRINGGRLYFTDE